jgi:hypothetical protein
MSRTVDLLRTQMAEGYEDLRGSCDGVTDDEFFWEPVPGSWTVFHEHGRWTYHYEEPDPVPAPMTTIGWRMVHLALCKVVYHEFAFGPRQLDFRTIENPGDVDTTLRMLEHGHHLLDSDLASLTDDDLDRPTMTNWGEEWPAWRIFWTMIDHDVHHGAEIGALRDLYRTLGPGARATGG